VFGDGRQARDFTYVGDVVAATAAALTAPVASGTVLNVANGEPVEVREVIGILAEELGVEPRIECHPERPGDTPRTDGCADAARDVLGWEPGTDVRSGLRRQVQWHLGRRHGAGSFPPGGDGGPLVEVDAVGVRATVGGDQLVQGMA
jgi:nucleoside-diphosphate-sugar epimerase